MAVSFILLPPMEGNAEGEAAGHMALAIGNVLQEVNNSRQAVGETSGTVTAVISKNWGNSDWAEYNYSVTNGTESAISGIHIKVPYSGTVNNLQSWNCSVIQSDGYIVISHSAVLAAGQTYSCIGSDSIKFGFAGGASFGTPVVEFVYGEDGGGTSSGKLKYELTGTRKDLAPADTPFGKHGKLKLAEVDGYAAPVIVDKNGKTFQLRGASTHGMHWNEMYPYVNKESFQSLRDEWGVNMVRLVSYVTQGGYTEGSQDLLDTKIQEGVDAATELGMYVIIDWHIHAENPHDTQSGAEAFFQKYATMYKDYDNVIFEICNEPTGVVWYNGSGSDLYSYCKDIVQIIRDCGSDALIVCGTNTWSQDVDEVAAKPLKDDGFENVLYSFHFYSGSHYDDKRNKVKTAVAAGTPVFVTEFGICDASGNGNFDTANADAWIELLDGYNISYACWSLCNKNESASYFNPSCTKTMGGWVESDLATTGIWLVNTYRAHSDAESGDNTSKEDISSSEDRADDVLEDVKTGYIDIEHKMNLHTENVPVNQESVLKAEAVILQADIKGVGTIPIKTPYKLAAKKTMQIKTDFLPKGAKNEAVTFISSNTKSALVDKNGRVTAKKPGTTVITVISENGLKKTFKLRIMKKAIKKIRLKGSKEMKVKKKQKLKAVVTPDKKYVGTGFVWKSGNEKVAMVSDSGQVKALTKGKVKITAYATDGSGKKDSIMIRVK